MVVDLRPEGLGDWSFMMGEAITISDFDRRFGPHDFDSGVVSGCGPGAKVHVVRWGRLEAQFSEPDTAAGRLIGWSYQTTGWTKEDPSVTVPLKPGPPLATPGGFTLTTVPETVDEIAQRLRAEFPYAVVMGTEEVTVTTDGGTMVVGLRAQGSGFVVDSMYATAAGEAGPKC
jgi:hypothetical protein